MDSKELQRILQQKFTVKGGSHSVVELEAIWKERVEEWQQVMRESTDGWAAVQQQMVDNIQGFCATYLYDSVEKKTFGLKEGTHYQAWYERLQQLIATIQQHGSLNEIQETLRQAGPSASKS